MSTRTLRLILLTMLLLSACAPTATPAPAATAPPSAPPAPTDTAPPPTATTVPTAIPRPPVVAGAAELDAYLSQPGLDFSGAVLVAKDGQVLLSKGYGLADRANNVANTPQTRFRLGDLTMQFTAMAILMLQADGQLNVQDSACQYLADCPAAWQAITLHHLLSASSGLPDFTPSEMNQTSTQTVDQALAALRDKPLLFQPGQGFAASHPGYMLLGQVIEQVSGQTYADFLQERIFAPLGMPDTGADQTEVDLAVGYDWSGSSSLALDTSGLQAAGALYSTVEDLFRWDQALYTDQLLPASLRQAMFTAQARFPGPDNVSYGYGWVRDVESGHPLWYDAGGGTGLSTGIFRYIDDRVTVIILGNSDRSFSSHAFHLAKQVLFGAGVPYGSYYGALAYDSESGQAIYFGGTQGDRWGGVLIDPETWAFDVQTRQWTAMRPAQAPAPVWGIQGALAYDSESDRVILFGGSTADYSRSAETWAYDFNTNTWTKRAAGPSGRAFHALAYDSQADRVILFGGLDWKVGAPPANMAALNDTWAYDYNTDTWTDLKPAASPGKRGGHLMAYDAQADRVIVWGGFIAGTSPSYSPEVWAYDYTANAWERRQDSAMSAGALAYDAQAGRIVGYGGIAMVNGNPYEDAVWTYASSADAWAKTALTPPAPAARWATSLVYVPDLKRVLMFGGTRGTGPVTETWLYHTQANTWEQIALVR